MPVCRTVTKEGLTNPVEIRIKDENLNFETARLIADQKATEMASEPMLLGWYDSNTGRYSPSVDCCSEHKPGWIVYAEARGGSITIDINNEKYVFIYRDLG
ncbi:MAG: AF1514 family protein [Desulfobacteraceae bacterium]|jgi:hypothetical protein